MHIIGKAALKPPLVIERKCYSRILNGENLAPDDREVKAFLREAIPQRFDSNTDSIAYLSQDQGFARSQEQKKMSEGLIEQKVLVNAFEFKDEEIFVQAERILYVEKIISIFKFNLKVSLGQVPRSRQNPYGLRLETVMQIDVKESENEK